MKKQHKQPEVVNDLTGDSIKAFRLPDGRYVTEKLAKEIEEPVCEELDEYASRAGFDYVDDIVLQAEPNHRWNDHDVENAYRDGIIAGAQWQKAQDDKYVDIIYQQGIEKGKDEMKEQMMKEAVEATVDDFGFHHSLQIKDKRWWEKLDHLKKGDKVKLIIVKED